MKRARRLVLVTARAAQLAVLADGQAPSLDGVTDMPGIHTLKA